MIEIKITNLPQLKRAFGLSPVLMGKNMSKAVQKTTFVISRQSRINTPVATGRLRASHYERFYGSGLNFSGEVGTHTSYDRFVHEGTRFMKARPYLSDAISQEQTTVDKFFTEAVQDTLDQIGGMV